MRVCLPDETLERTLRVTAPTTGHNGGRGRCPRNLRLVIPAPDPSPRPSTPGKPRGRPPKPPNTTECRMKPLSELPSREPGAYGGAGRGWALAEAGNLLHLLAGRPPASLRQNREVSTSCALCLVDEAGRDRKGAGLVGQDEGLLLRHDVRGRALHLHRWRTRGPHPLPVTVRLRDPVTMAVRTLGARGGARGGACRAAATTGLMACHGGAHLSAAAQAELAAVAQAVATPGKVRRRVSPEGGQGGRVRPASGRGPEFTASEGASGDVLARGPGFPPDLRPCAPPSPRLVSLPPPGGASRSARRPVRGGARGEARG